ncbi:hypothetical protein COLO4_01259, partial [Corchorus olitorius]
MPASPSIGTPETDRSRISRYTVRSDTPRRSASIAAVVKRRPRRIWAIWNRRSARRVMRGIVVGFLPCAIRIGRQALPLRAEGRQLALRVDVDDVDLLATAQHALAQSWEIGNLDVEMFAAAQVDEIFLAAVAQVVRDACGEGHEIAAAHGEDVVVDLGLRFAGKDVDPFLFPLVRVIDERLLARRHAREVHAGALEPEQPAHHRAVNFRQAVPGVRKRLRARGDIGGTHQIRGLARHGVLLCLMVKAGARAPALGGVTAVTAAAGTPASWHPARAGRRGCLRCRRCGRCGPCGRAASWGRTRIGHRCRSRARARHPGWARSGRPRCPCRTVQSPRPSPARRGWSSHPPETRP